VEREPVTTLDCTHRFHESCVRGWCIIGKKQTCPYCKEKVDLDKKFPTPWHKHDILYAQLLDALRYLLVWQPVIVLAIRFEIWGLGLK